MTDKIISRSASPEAQIFSRLSADSVCLQKLKDGVGALMKSMTYAVYTEGEGLLLSRGAYNGNNPPLQAFF
jgi:hypothetical protein